MEKMILNAKDKPKSKLKWLLLSFQHVFAMFGATVLVPILTGLPISVALFTSGLGTLIYIACTKAKVPVYLGSSFAYIPVIQSLMKNNGLGAVFTGMFFVGVIYCLIALAVRFFGKGWIKKVLPPIIVGPMIMIIGLGLSTSAISNAGLVASIENVSHLQQWKMIFLPAGGRPQGSPLRPACSVSLGRGGLYGRPFRLSKSLPHRLVQQNGGGGAGVEGVELPLHGDAHQHVAGLGHQAAHAVPLAADDDGGGALQVGLIEGAVPGGIRAEHPQPLVLELLQAGGEVGHPRHRDVAHRPGGGLGHHRRQPGGAALGDDHPVGPGALGGADHRPQVVGVGELVAHHHQRGLPLLPGGGQDVVHAGVLPDGGLGDDPLVGVGAAHGVQLAPVGVHHHDALFPGGGGDVAQGGVRVPTGKEDFINGNSGPKRLDDGVPALDDPVVLLLHRGGAAGDGGAFFHGDQDLPQKKSNTKFSIPQPAGGGK